MVNMILVIMSINGTTVDMVRGHFTEVIVKLEATLGKVTKTRGRRKIPCQGW